MSFLHDHFFLFLLGTIIIIHRSQKEGFIAARQFTIKISNIYITMLFLRTAL